MEVILSLLLTFAFPFLIYGGLSLVGILIERRHLADLDQRETDLGTFPIFDTASPIGVTASSGQLVTGSAVMGTGYLKQLMAAFRTLVGGEVGGMQKVLDRGRREAQLRMIANAQSLGAQAITNVRFETSDIGGGKPVAEIFCYGTAVR